MLGLTISHSVRSGEKSQASVVSDSDQSQHDQTGRFYINVHSAYICVQALFTCKYIYI